MSTKIRRGTTNGYKWRVIRDGARWRMQAIVPMPTHCAIVGKSYDTPDAAEAAVKQWASKQPPALPSKGCKFPAVKYGRAVR